MNPSLCNYDQCGPEVDETGFGARCLAILKAGECLLGAEGRGPQPHKCDSGCKKFNELIFGASEIEPLGVLEVLEADL